MGIADINREADNLSIGIGIGKTDRKADHPDTGMTDIDVDRGMDYPGIRIVDGDKTSNPGIDKDKKADERVDEGAASSNKTRTFLFLLCKVLFILIFSSELETVSISSFISLLFPVILVKRKVLSFKYFLAKMWMPSENKALSAMMSVPMPLKFFAKYF